MAKGQVMGRKLFCAVVLVFLQLFKNLIHFTKVIWEKGKPELRKGISQKPI